MGFMAVLSGKQEKTKHSDSMIDTCNKFDITVMPQHALKRISVAAYTNAPVLL